MTPLDLPPLTVRQKSYNQDPYWRLHASKFDTRKQLQRSRLYSLHCTVHRALHISMAEEVVHIRLGGGIYSYEQRVAIKVLLICDIWWTVYPCIRTSSRRVAISSDVRPEHNGQTGDICGSRSAVVLGCAICRELWSPFFWWLRYSINRQKYSFF